MARGVLVAGMLAGVLTVSALPGPARADRISASGLHVEAGASSTRLTFDISGEAGFAIRQVDGGITVDLSNLDWQVPPAQLQQPFGSLVKSVVFEHPIGTVAMIVIATSRPVQVIQAIETAGQPTRLQIDLAPRGSAPAEIAAASPDIAPAVPPPPPEPAKPAAPARLPMVVIDPGDGGTESGRVAADGTKEKDIALALAQALKAQLDQDGKVAVTLTRDRDVTLSIPSRLRIVHDKQADLFLALGATSSANAALHGFSIERYADKTEDKGSGTSAEADADPDVDAILSDLVERETGDLTTRFIKLALDEVGKATHDLATPSQSSAPYAILKGLDMPALVIEAGYLSNRQDERDLRDLAFRTRLAGALARAIETYFAQAGDSALAQARIH